MRNLKLTLAYDGTRYHGWQIQPTLPTIQGELQLALGTLLGHPVAVIGSGRTDAGVHAHAQVANAHTHRSIDTDALLRALNALLPSDIRILSVEEVNLSFHSRFSAQSKTYEYHVCRSAIVSPFQYRYVYPLTAHLEAAAVDLATAHFVGRHVFTSFSSASTGAEDHERTVHQAQWARDGLNWTFRIRADGFLQHMVRTIVGTLLDVGRRKTHPDEIPKIFEAMDRRRAGPTLPGYGLHLVEVHFDA